MNKLVLTVFALIFLAAVAIGEVVQLSYGQLHEVPVVKLSGYTNANTDSTTWDTTPLHAATAPVGGKTVVFEVTGTSAGATCEMTLGLYHYDTESATWTFLGLSASQTVTLGTQTTAAGKKIATITGAFDLFGAPYYDLRVTAVSAGVMAVIPWNAGFNSTPSTAEDYSPPG